MATFALPFKTHYDAPTVFPEYVQPVQYGSCDLDYFPLTPTQSFDAERYFRGSCAGSTGSLSVSSSVPGLQSSSRSTASIESTPPSTMASPLLDMSSQQYSYHNMMDGNMGLDPSLVSFDEFSFGPPDLGASGLGFDPLLAGDKGASCVDPALVQQIPTPKASATPPFSFQLDQSQLHFPTQHTASHMISPTASHASSQGIYAYPQTPRQPSPRIQPGSWPPQFPMSRPASVHSMHSQHSQLSRENTSSEIDEDGRERRQCPYPDCRKKFKDLKAHMLTHQNERPEKCPIVSCEFHKRGFARKYDRNRHLVTTHYKSTMVCGFCPGTGSVAERTFNRTDVFKRHLVTVHGVEQNPPNSRKKSPKPTTKASPNPDLDGTGKCSTCGSHFDKPQDLFEHIDDCILRVVQRPDPTEANNERLLSSVAGDSNVQQTMDKHQLPNSVETSYVAPDGDDDEVDDVVTSDGAFNSRAARSGKGSLPSYKQSNTGVNLHSTASGQITKANTSAGAAAGNSNVRTGLTYSKGGVPLSVAKGRRRRKHYPQSWGCQMDKMKMKKRVLCLFDGQRRLWKDDMMLGNDYEVRMKLADGESWVTDLDVQTMRRADAFHHSSPDERGPWVLADHNGNPTSPGGTPSSDLIAMPNMQDMEALMLSA